MRTSLLLVALVGCTGAPDSDSDVDSDVDTDTTPLTCAETSATGTIALSIAFETDLAGAMDEGEVPVGIFYGQVFRGEDVSGAGPVDAAVVLAEIETGEVDVTDGGPTDAELAIDDVTACTVVILGCLDTDANGCERHDPVTLPNNNRFPIAGGATPTPVTVFLGLLNPS